MCTVANTYTVINAKLQLGLIVFYLVWIITYLWLVFAMFLMLQLCAQSDSTEHRYNHLSVVPFH